MATFNLALIFELLAIVVCLFVGMLRWKAIPASARWFVIQSGLALIVEIFGRVTGRSGINNQVYFNIYILLEFATILLAARDFYGRGFLPVASVAGLLFASVFGYDMAHTGLFYAAFHAITAAWLILGSIYLAVLVRCFFQPEGRPLRPLVILSATLFGYYFLTAPRFSLLRFIQETLSQGVGVNFSALTAVFACMKYLGIAIALYLLAQANRKGKKLSAREAATLA